MTINKMLDLEANDATEVEWCVGTARPDIIQFPVCTPALISLTALDCGTFFQVLR